MLVAVWATAPLASGADENKSVLHHGVLDDLLDVLDKDQVSIWPSLLYTVTHTVSAAGKTRVLAEQDHAAAGT